jgi:hypothetical protein
LKCSVESTADANNVASDVLGHHPTIMDVGPDDKRWGRGGGGRRSHRPHGPQAANSWWAPDENPHGVHGWLVSGALLLISKDAGPRPAPRLPLSRCASRTC